MLAEYIHQVLQELRTVAIFNNSTLIKIIFVVLDAAAIGAIVVLQLFQPSETPSERTS